MALTTQKWDMMSLTEFPRERLGQSTDGQIHVRLYVLYGYLLRVFGLGSRGLDFAFFWRQIHQRVVSWVRKGTEEGLSE